jgi:uncharacterized membrane protein YphA (DoxX/SURF4 family)
MNRFSLLDVIIFLLAVLFLYAASAKFMTFVEFQAQLGKSPLIANYAKTIAWTVPFVEVLISLLVLIPRTLLYGLYASFFLMFIFTAYIAFILTFSPYVPCSCGGILNTMGWTEHLIFNSFFVSVTVTGIILHNRKQKMPPRITAL